MLARPGGQGEHHDYDNPSLSMSNDNVAEGPRMMSSHESLDAGVVRPAMINIIPGDEIVPAPVSPEVSEETRFTLPPGDDIEKPGKLKGLFGKKNKEKKEKKEKKGKKEKKKDDANIEEGEVQVQNGEQVDDMVVPVAASKGPSIGQKLKGLFKGKGGDKEPVVTTPGSEGAGLEAANPAYEASMTTSPVDSPTGEAGDLPPTTYSAGPTDTVPKTTPSKPLMSLLRKPKLPPPDPEAEPRAELREMPPSHAVRCSNVLNSVLLLGIILGILFLILNGVSHNSTLAVLGPVFLGLSAFALIGKVFVTLFWQEDPLPRLKPYVQKFEDALGPKGGVRPQSKHTVIARSSHYGMTYDPNYGLPPAQTVDMGQEPNVQRYGGTYPQEQKDPSLREPEISQAPTFI